MILANASVVTALLGAGAALAYLLPALARSRMGERWVRRGLILAWALHGVSLLLGFSAEAPRFGFGPVVSVTAWLVLTVYGLERQWFPQMQTHWGLSVLGAAAVVLALVFPGAIHASTTTPWLPLHWALGVASYGLFAAAAIHSWLLHRADRKIRLAADTDGLPVLTLERLIFRFVGIGFTLLTATLLLGFFFTDSLYGPGAVDRVPRWDHKTVFSVASWVAFAVLLLGRHAFGWRGKRAARILYAGAALLVLAYVGSRFVLEVLLGRTT